ncbi:rRNA pseudouridine synthase [bacterium]|nr:MAG: rRNA pseudouridine synthase [bacterium]
MAYRPKLSKTASERPNAKPASKPASKKRYLQAKPEKDTETIRLNKFISRSGICSRRDADVLIQEGKVEVNGAVVKEMGYQVQLNDSVKVNGTNVHPENFIYILLNKPTNTITSTDDEKGRQTVMDLVEANTGHRLYPVGRLDRNTTGLILLTNDGDLANRLMHPSYKIGKVYEVTANRYLSDEELEQLRKGVELEDGIAKAYRVERHLAKHDSVLISVHEGRNHLVRRMVAFFGAEVIKLKRIQYASLYIDKLRVGRWRFLKAFEVNKLRASVKLPELRFTKS